MKPGKLFLLYAAVFLLAAAAFSPAASSADSGAAERQIGQSAATMPDSSPTARGLVAGRDGFEYYYDRSGKLVKGDFVKIDARTIYYFSRNGRGIKQYFHVHNDRLIQFWNIGGRTTCFLVIGDKEAFLLDSLFGMGRIANMMRFFTDKPLSLAMTHGSVDHSAGAYAYQDFKRST